ncbi:MAG: class I SAM-dependent methyltransferase [Candidatus Omnitrophica bacterium]|nr:class I SAM-dependent methyltransferase [Candidatus Omnitrophota bacterium]
MSLALAVKENNMQAKVFSLDINYFNTKEEFINNIKRFNLKDVIIPIFRPSSLATIGWKRPLKFIFIDTDGRYFSIKSDFILWERFLLKDGIIALSCAHSSDIKRFFRKYIENSNRFKDIRICDDIIFAYKQKYAKIKIIYLIYIRIIYMIYILLKKLIYRLKRKVI